MVCPWPLAGRTRLPRGGVFVLMLHCVSGTCPASGLDGHKRDAYRCCGVNCLATIAHLHGLHVSVESLEKLIRPRENSDCSVGDIERAALAIGLRPTSVQLEWSALRYLPAPCIVQLRSPTRYATGSHFVVLMGLHRTGVILLDPPNPGMLHPYEEFQGDWSGVAIAFPADGNEKRDFIARVASKPAWAVWATRGSIGAALAAFTWLLIQRRVQNGRSAQSGGSQSTVPFLD
jgi:ABC-type bacteriocin/lantibiotic exporter with double-glycine peptidase domain